MDARTSARPGVPVACTLGREDGAQRRRRWEALSVKGRANAQRLGHRLVVRYQHGPGVGEELSALAAAERQCCSFVLWTARDETEFAVLEVVADPSCPDDIAAIAVLFGAD